MDLNIEFEEIKITLPNDINWNSKIEHLYGERVINLKLSDLNHLYNIDTFEIAKKIGEENKIIEFNNFIFKKIECVDYLK